MFILTSQTDTRSPDWRPTRPLGEAFLTPWPARPGGVVRGLAAVVLVSATAGLDMSFLTASRAYAPWALLTGGETSNIPILLPILAQPRPSDGGLRLPERKWPGAVRALILATKVSTCRVPWASGVFNEQWIALGARSRLPRPCGRSYRSGKNHAFLINMPSNLWVGAANQ